MFFGHVHVHCAMTCPEYIYMSGVYIYMYICNYKLVLPELHVLVLCCTDEAEKAEIALFAVARFLMPHT